MILRLSLCLLCLGLYACGQSDSAIGGAGLPARDLGDQDTGGQDEPDMSEEPDLAPDEPDMAPDLPDEPDVVEEEDMDTSLLGAPCAEDPEQCTFEGLICAIARGDEGVLVTCQALDESDQALGEACEGDQACQAGLCLQEWLSEACSGPCVDDQDCPLPGYRCQERALVQDANVLTRVCVPPEPQPCQANADCPEGELCSIRPNAAGDALVPVCQPAGAGDDLGQTCNSDQACAAGLCLEGHCAALCRDMEDCAGGEQRCQEVTWSQDGLEGQFNLCRTLPEMDCARDAECAQEGRVCGEVRFEEPPRALCIEPLEGGLGLGQACTGSLSANDQCEGRVCLRNITDQCTRLCVTDQDCGGFPQEHQCNDFRFGGQTVRMCARACPDDATCQGEQGHICALSRDNTDDQFKFICRAATGDDAPGSDCSDEVDCDHGICLIRRSNGEVLERVCTLPCDDDGDCPEALPVCGTADITTPGGNDRQTLRVCNRVGN